ncbi:MAG: glycosyltransferase [Ignavibacteriae bacterium]|nr:glycosyltransferase [Ignavibacteriota bacterium]
MTLLFFSDIAWEHLYQRPQHLASRLAERGTLLWIEPATLGTPRRWQPEQKAKDLFLLTLPQFPHNARSRPIRLASRLLSSIPPLRWCLTQVQSMLLKRACRSIGIDPGSSPAFVENFQFAPLIARITPAGVVFDYIDDAFGFVDIPAYVRKDWRRMIRLADRITVTAGVLQRQIAQETSTPIEIVENGVNTGSYAGTPERPADLPVDGKPVVIYVGTISHWFDLRLVDRLLQSLPDVHVVLVGPVHPDCAARLNASRKFTNLHVLGARAHADIPAYLAAANVGIIPFVRNRLTEAVNPVKLYEYTAAGIPVVSTAFSDDLEKLRHLAFIAHTPEEFLAQVRTALARGADVPDAARLREFARANDWQARADAMAGLIDAAMKTRRTR